MLAALSMITAVALAGDLAPGDTTTVEIQAASAYWHSALTLDEGCYEIDLVEGATYTAWNAWGVSRGYACDADGYFCRIGFLTDYRLRAEIDYPGSGSGSTAASSADASGTLLLAHTSSGYYNTALLALGETYTEDFCLSAEQEVDFNVGDWGAWGDNIGGLTLELTRLVFDEDDDGVDDDDDLCPGTPAGEVVDADGCSPEQSVELQCPSDDAWTNHGAYMSCVTDAVNDLVAAGLLSNSEAADIKRAAAQSGVGR